MKARTTHSTRARRSVGAVAAALALILLIPTGAMAGHKPSGPPAPPAGSATKTLILYDTQGPWGWLGEKYAILTANLVSHFGTYTTKPVAEYKAGEMSGYAAAIYIGSSWDEPIPEAFIADTLAEKSQVMWVNWNIWQLTNSAPDFFERYGWKDALLDHTDPPHVAYKGKMFTRYAGTGAIMDYVSVNTSKATVLAEAVRADGSRFPWALRSKNLFYIGELPFSYMSETNRYLAFSDILFDLLAPETPERHRALVRLEDVGCDSDPWELVEIADYLGDRDIPFSFGVYPVYKDPLGVDNDGRPTMITLRDKACRGIVGAIKYMIARGGVMIHHGTTHQCDCSTANPYNGKSGDDFEFFTAHVDDQDYVRYDGPVPGDSYQWALARMKWGIEEFKRAKLPLPSIFEFPHYAASSEDYRAANTLYDVRYERALYFSQQLRGGTVNNNKFIGQFFPYAVNDIHGTKVIPENIGNIEVESFNHHPVTLPDELIRRAELNLAVRDGFASFFYHPHLGVDHLRQTVEGIQALGYTFVSPHDV